MAQFLDFKISQIVTSAEGLYGAVQILPEQNIFLKWSSLRGKPLQTLTETNQRGDGKPGQRTTYPKHKFLSTLLMTRDDKYHTIQYLPGVRSYTDVSRCTLDYLEVREAQMSRQFSQTLNSLAFLCKGYKASKVRQSKPCLGATLFFQLYYKFCLIFVSTNITLDIFTFMMLCSQFQSSIIPAQYQLSNLVNFLPPLLSNYSICLFMLLSTFTFVLSLCCRCKGVCISVMYELVSVGFLVLNIFKITAIVSTIFNLSNQESQNLLLQTTLVILSLAFILLHFLALCLIRPRDCLGKPFKYLFSLLAWLLFYHTLFYMSSIYLVSSLCSFRRKSPLRCLCNFLTFLGWFFLQMTLLFLMVKMQDEQYLLIALLGITLLWHLSRIMESLLFWCRYQCKMRGKLYGPLKKYLQSLRQKQDSPQQSTRRALARSGSNMSATSATNKSSESTESIPKTKNILHINKNHKRIPSLQTALDSIKEVDFREELTHRLNELSFHKDSSRGKFGASSPHSPDSPNEPHWAMIQSPFVLTNEIRIEGLEGTEEQLTDNSLALTSLEEGDIDDEATVNAPRQLGAHLEKRNTDKMRDHRRDMTFSGMHTARSSGLIQSSDFSRKRASLNKDSMFLKCVKEMNEDLEEDIEEKEEEHTAPETQNENNESSESEEGGSSGRIDRKEYPISITFEGSEGWNGNDRRSLNTKSMEGHKEPPLQKKNNVGEQ